MGNKGGNIVKTVLQWLAVVFLLIMAFAWTPEIGGWLYLLAAIIALPIKPLNNFCEKHKIKNWMRVVAAFVIFLLVTAGYVGKSISDGGLANAGYDVGGGSNAGQTSGQTSGVDITGTWKYEEEQAIESEYKFNSDGTWKFTSEGGAYDEGTYEIVNGDTIKGTGMFYEIEFKIIDKKHIETPSGEKLKKK